MKIMCYFVLGIALLMYYQQNPVFTGVIIIAILGLYVFFKRRKNKGPKRMRTGMFGMFSGNQATQEGSTDALIALLALQQFSNSPQGFSECNNDDKEASERHEIDEHKSEIIQLFEDW
jgi:hypothetical protein